MYQIADFYSLCRAQSVDVIACSRLPAPAITVRDGGDWAVGLNFAQLAGVRALRTATLHEAGHVATGALHKIDSPYQLVAKNEHTADAWAFEHYLTAAELLAAMRQGCTEPWQLAEYFELDEALVVRALRYWSECRGVDFNAEKA